MSNIYIIQFYKCGYSVVEYNSYRKLLLSAVSLPFSRLTVTTSGTIVPTPPFTVSFLNMVVTWLNIEVTLLVAVVASELQSSQNDKSMKTAIRSLQNVFYEISVTFSTIMKIWY